MAGEGVAGEGLRINSRGMLTEVRAWRWGPDRRKQLYRHRVGTLGERTLLSFFIDSGGL